MRTGGVPVAALLLLLLSSTMQIRAAEDLYWEGEEDASNEFLEVKEADFGIAHHLRRLKRGFFDFFDPFGSSTTESPTADSATEDFDDSELPEDREDLDHEGSGLPEKIELEHKEKTLRVTFVAMEPYQRDYSNRDSVQFRNFSRSLADAVDQLFEPIGTRRASLVRIQSRVSDEFSCKVTLDILTTGYEDTNRLTEILRDHIKNRRKLGTVTVSDTDFSANVIDPDTPLDPCAADEIACDGDRCVPENSRCNGVIECFDGTDELNCPSGLDNEIVDEYDRAKNISQPRPPCDNPIPCQDRNFTICPEQRCDGVYDCPNQEDELNCFSPETTTISLTGMSK